MCQATATDRNDIIGQPLNRNRACLLERCRIDKPHSCRQRIGNHQHVTCSRQTVSASSANAELLISAQRLIKVTAAGGFCKNCIIIPSSLLFGPRRKPPATACRAVTQC